MKYSKWILQARRDLEAATTLAASGFHEWACFISLQAAEKAEKAYFVALGMEPPLRRGKEGHDLVSLSSGWPDSVKVAEPAPKLAEAQARLNQHAENTRYPHAKSDSAEFIAPSEGYHRNDSQQAIDDARAVVEVCEKLADEGQRFASKLGEVLRTS